MTEEGTSSLPAAVTKAYDILLWLITHVGKFPRSHRFVLGDRIESRMLSLLESLVLAAYARDKREHLRQANGDVQVLRLLVRAGKDHGVLLGLITERIWDEGALWVIRTILEGSNPQPEAMAYFPGDDLFTPFERRRGIPIGNQTSQFFANVYLDKLDHYVKEDLRARGYVRYVDDVLVFDHDKHRLHEVRSAIDAYLGQLRLRLHPRKCFVTTVTSGVTFLGYRIFPTHRRLDADKVRCFKRRLRRYHRAVAEGWMSASERRDRIRSWIAHAQHADTARLRRRVLGDNVFCGGSQESLWREASRREGELGRDSPGHAGSVAFCDPRWLLEQ